MFAPPSLAGKSCGRRCDSYLLCGNWQYQSGEGITGTKTMSLPIKGANALNHAIKIPPMV